MINLSRPPLLCCHSFNIPPLVSPTHNRHSHTLLKYYANWADLSSPLSPSSPPLPPLSLLLSPLLLPPPQFPPLPKLIVVCACLCCCCHSHCHFCRCCCRSRSRCCCHYRCHCCCHRRSRHRPLHHCLTTTSQLSITTTIECRFHPPLPLLLLPSTATVKRQCTQLSIAAIVSLVAGHFLRQSLTATLRRYCFQPTPTVFVACQPHRCCRCPRCRRCRCHRPRCRHLPVTWCLHGEPSGEPTCGNLMVDMAGTRTLYH
jgi:hypothetical protein